MTKIIVCTLILATCSLSVSAQDSANQDKDRQYVTDQLRLSIYQEPNSQSKTLKLLRSGDLLIVDEIRGPYALVTDAEGTRGWVKRGFLVTSPTANIQLREEQEKNANLFEEIEKLSNSKAVIETYEKDMDELVQKIEALETEKQAAQANMAELNQESEAKQQKIEKYLERKQQNIQPPITVLLDTLLAYWRIIVPALLLLLAICFLVSKAIVEARIKARFHGIKIW